MNTHDNTAHNTVRPHALPRVTVPESLEKAQTPGRKTGKKGPVGLKKVVSVSDRVTKNVYITFQFYTSNTTLAYIIY